MITFAYQNRAIMNDYLMACYAQKHNNHADSQSLRITPFLLQEIIRQENKDDLQSQNAKQGIGTSGYDRITFADYSTQQKNHQRPYASLQIEKGYADFP